MPKPDSAKSTLATISDFKDMLDTTYTTKPEIYLIFLENQKLIAQELEDNDAKREIVFFLERFIDLIQSLQKGQQKKALHGFLLDSLEIVEKHLNRVSNVATSSLSPKQDHGADQSPSAKKDTACLSPEDPVEILDVSPSSTSVSKPAQTLELAKKEFFENLLATYKNSERGTKDAIAALTEQREIAQKLKNAEALNFCNYALILVEGYEQGNEIENRLIIIGEQVKRFGEVIQQKLSALYPSNQLDIQESGSAARASSTIRSTQISDTDHVGSPSLLANDHGKRGRYPSQWLFPSSRAEKAMFVIGSIAATIMTLGLYIPVVALTVAIAGYLDKPEQMNQSSIKQR